MQRVVGLIATAAAAAVSNPAGLSGPRLLVGCNVRRGGGAGIRGATWIGEDHVG